MNGLVLDGEVVALDEAGRPSFQRLQQRGKLTRSLDIRQGAVENPVTFYGFDLLAADGFDLRPLPLTVRKALLRKLLPPAGAIRYLDHFEGEGELLYQQVQSLGLEGMVAKRADSPYRAGRSPCWLKIRTRRSDDFVVVGFTAPKGGRSGFGALQLGQYVDGKLTYSGRAGSGFTDRQLAEMGATLEQARRADPACVGTIPEEKGNTWVEPRLVCEVEYTEWTEEGLLRQPVFVRFRDDKRPQDCVRPAGQVGAEEERHEGAPALAQTTLQQAVLPSRPAAATPRLEFSNLKKVFWPEDGYTKGDLIEYYRSISEWILPYLADRPVVLTRYPDGINGKSFFQKDAPAFVPDWIRTERMWSEQAEREIDYFICNDEDSLLYLVNLGTIPLHVWGSRTEKIDRPDWCILDLDPKGAPFSDVVRSRPSNPCSLPGYRAAQLREDQRIVRPSRDDSARMSVPARRGTKPGRASGPAHRGRAAGDYNPYSTGVTARREGLYRLSPEWVLGGFWLRHSACGRFRGLRCRCRCAGVR